MKTDVNQGPRSWIGIDLDGTLAFYDRWRGNTHIGAPIPEMIKKVRQWISEGREVRIFTARMAETNSFERQWVYEEILKWTKKHIGKPLPATCVKDMNMAFLVDDRAITANFNEGSIIGEWPKGF